MTKNKKTREERGEKQVSTLFKSALNLGMVVRPFFPKILNTDRSIVFSFPPPQAQRDAVVPGQTFWCRSWR